MPNWAKPAASDSLKETRDKDSSVAAALKAAVFAKLAASDSLKETRDKDSSLAAALQRWFCQSRVLPILSKRPGIRIRAWRQLSKRRFSTRCSPKALFCVKYARPRASDSLKETRDKRSSRAAALKAAVFSPAPAKTRFYAKRRSAGCFEFSQRDPG